MRVLPDLYDVPQLVIDVKVQVNLPAPNTRIDLPGIGFVVE